MQFRNGPITLAEYMSEVLTNPTAGYYINRDVFGRSGDFITSPEISQMFGEVGIAWVEVMAHLDQSARYCSPIYFGFLSLACFVADGGHLVCEHLDAAGKSLSSENSGDGPRKRDAHGRSFARHSGIFPVLFSCPGDGNGKQSELFLMLQ